MKMIDEVGISNKLRYICPNHEQALAMMVDSYARIQGFGVGMVTSGPGAVNLATGIACSYYDSVPCLYISGQVGNFHIRRDRTVRQRGFQETDCVSLFKSITKYSALLDDPHEARYIFEKAVHISKHGRPGPVFLEIPYDVQRALVSPGKLRKFIPPKKVDSINIAEIAKSTIRDLMNAERPLVLAGGGVRISGMGKTLMSFLDVTKTPVVTTWGATDIFTHDYELHLGNIGKSGNQSAVTAVQQCDLLLCLGTRFTPKEIINEEMFAKSASIIAVDIDNAELDQGLINIDKKINCDLRSLISNLVRFQPNEPISTNHWLSRTESLKNEKHRIDGTIDSENTYVSPYGFVEKLSDNLPPGSVIVADTGANLTWAMQSYKIKSDQRLISAWGNSPMGYAMAGAVGARLAIPDLSIPIICIIGDGGLQMNIQEFQTIVGNAIDIKIFVLNNRSYGNIVFGAIAEFDREFGNTADSGYTVPNFISIAHAYGIATENIQANHQIDSTIKRVLNQNGPVLVNVEIDPKQDHLETVIS